MNKKTNEIIVQKVNDYRSEICHKAGKEITALDYLEMPEKVFNFVPFEPISTTNALKVAATISDKLKTNLDAELTVSEMYCILVDEKFSAEFELMETRCIVCELLGISKYRLNYRIGKNVIPVIKFNKLYDVWIARKHY